MSSSIDFFPSSYEDAAQQHAQIPAAAPELQQQQQQQQPAGFDAFQQQAPQQPVLQPHQQQLPQQPVYDPNMYAQQQPQAGQAGQAAAGFGGGGYGGGYAGQPGLTGTMDSGMAGGPSDNFGDEPPLLEELGIDPVAIRQKAMAVLNPKTQLDEATLHDEDISGPFVICVILGGILLLGGKLHFGYLFGYSIAGSLMMKMLLSLMAQFPISIYHTMSVLGYCLMPMIVLAISCMFTVQNSMARFLVVAVCIYWSTHSASAMFVRVLRTNEQMLLFMYPIFLLYTCFALIVMF